MAERQKPSSFSHSLLRFFAFVPSWIPSQNLRTGEAKDDTGKLFLSSYSDATNASFIDARKRKSSKRNNDSKDSFDEISRRIRGRVESQPSWFRIFLYDWIPHVCSISLYALISIHPYIDFAIVPSTFPFDISILKSRCIIQSVRSKIELRDMDYCSTFIEKEIASFILNCLSIIRHESSQQYSSFEGRKITITERDAQHRILRSKGIVWSLIRRGGK